MNTVAVKKASLCCMVKKRLQRKINKTLTVDNSFLENWKKKVESYRERLLEEERKMKKLDPLRPKTDDDDEMMGTFRQLNVD